MVPVIMAGGTIIARIAGSRLATKLAGKLASGQRIVQKPLSQVKNKNIPNVTNVNQAKNLKPPTKVVGKNNPKVTNIKQTPTPKNKPLRADPAFKPQNVKSNKSSNKTKTTVAGTPTQKKIVGTALTAASLAGLLPDRKGSGKSQAGTSSSNLSAAQKEAAAKRRITQADAKRNNTNKTNKNKPKSFKDYKSVAAAQADNFDFFMGKDGKKKLAITKEQLKKSGLSLNAMANKVRKERNATVKQLVDKAARSSTRKS